MIDLRELRTPGNNMEQTQQNHWGFALGDIRPPEEWSGKNAKAEINGTLAVDDSEKHDDVKKNQCGKYIHLSPKQKKDLIKNITELLKSGLKTGPEVLKRLEIDGNVPVHLQNSSPVANDCIYRYVRIIREKLGIKPEPLMMTRIVESYKSGITNRKQIMKTIGCSESIIRKALLRNGFIKKAAKIKKTR
jgi:hypothetical protein